MSADFKPELGAHKSLRPFVFWAQTTLPTVFDDSLSYYEVLTKLTKMVNTLLENTDTTEANVEALATAYDELQAYVNDYFENLDVTTEIDNKLEEWRDAGIIDNMVDSYVAPIIHDYLYGPDDEGGVQKTLEDMLADATESLNNALSSFSSDSRQALNDFERDSRDALTDFEDATNDALDAIPNTVDAWLDQNFTNPSSPPLDATLSLENAAAQAKATGERCDQLEDLVLSNNDWINSVSEVVSNQYVVVNDDGTNPRIANDASSDPLRPMSVANITGGRSYLISCVGNTVGPNTFSPAYAICNLSYDLQDEPVYTILDFYPRSWDPNEKTYEIIRSRSVYIPETIGLQTVNCLILMGNTDITVTPKCGVLSVKTDNTLTNPLLPANAKATGDALANKLPWPVTEWQKDLGANGKALLSNGDGTTRWGDAGGNYDQEISDLKSSINNMHVNRTNITPFAVGAINSSTGNDLSSTTRLRSTERFDNSFIGITANSGYQFLMFAYASNEYVGAWNGSEFAPGSSTYVASFTPDPTWDYEFRISIKRTDNDDMSISESENIVFAFATDTTLRDSGKPADSKTTGDAIRNIDNYVDTAFLGMSSNNIIPLFIINGISKLSSGKAVNGSGAVVNEPTSYATEDFIEIKYGAEKVKSSVSLISGTSFYQYIAFYDANKTFISRSGGGNASNIDVFPPADAKYCRWSLTYVGLGNVASCSFTAYLPLTRSPENKWYVLGDSISAGYYSMTKSMADAEGLTFSYVSPVTTEGGEVTGSVWDNTLGHNYWGYANKWFLNRELVCRAYPGQGFLRTASNSQNGVYVVDNNNFSDAGLITVAWGFNDWHYDQPRGDHNLIDNNTPVPTDNFDTSQITTINHAIWYCLGRLIKKAPNAKIAVQTPMNGWAYGGDFSTNWSINYAKTNSGTLKQIHDDIIYWCDYYGLQYIDMTFNNSVVNRVNIKDTIIDGSHPSDEAHKQLARSVWTMIGY